MLLQSVIIIFPLIAPAVLQHKKKYLSLSALLTVFMMVDIFNSQVYLNLSAIKLASISLLPYSVFNFKRVVRNPVVIFISLFLLVLSISSILNTVFPEWDRSTYEFFIKKDRPPFRSILHLGSLFLELHLFYFLGDLICRDNKCWEIIEKAIIFSAGLLCVFSMIEILTTFDFYHFFTGGTKFGHMLPRTRGLTYEPRGLSQNVAVGLTLALQKYGLRLKALPLYAFLIYFGILTSSSMAGYLTLFIGLSLLLSYNLHIKGLKTITPKSLYSFVAIIAMMGLAYSLIEPHKKESYYKHLTYRLNYMSKLSLKESLESQESLSLETVIKAPRFLIIGTGAGLAYIPIAEKMILSRGYSLEKYQGKVYNSLPHMGSILALSNGGLIAFVLLIFSICYCIRLSAKLASSKLSDHKTIFHITLFGLLYLLQVRYLNHIWISIAVYLLYLNEVKPREPKLSY